MKTRNFAVVTISIAVVLGLLIYWREYSARSQVALFQVLLWQIGIWGPWVLGFELIKQFIGKTAKTKFGILFLAGTCIIWIGLHFGWFFFISSNFSPYLGLPGSRFGVYRYFFIFWTLIDIGLLWFIIDKLKSTKDEEVSPPLLLELTRGNNKYFCEPSQIQWLAAENYYTKLCTTEGVFVMRKPLKSFHDLLPQDMFKRIHRSTIINVNYVSELERGNGQSLKVVMRDGTRRRVSRNFVKETTLFFKDRTY
ncbi:LytTR family DNA-binding domain-containing protein [Ulvibacterium sp.]|uniref:LytTR family DNA-binding domain-containing protein n=1 Tax=Ulvibacterium sp. TaxID=2665914 RepID=UPI00262C654D|nr:LytTR family DNA-binding domain-containing protein [Ulvibacterium sp.]